MFKKVSSIGVTIFILTIISLLLTFAEWKWPENVKIPALGLVTSVLFGASLSYILNMLHKRVAEEPCAYRNRFEKVGIIHIYRDIKEPVTKDGTYLYDLLKDLKKLSSSDTSEDEPIKMMGVSLDNFFAKEPLLVNRIYELCRKSAYFKIMVCDTENTGLKLRSKLMLASEKYNKKTVEWGKKEIVEWGKTKLHRAIANTHNCISDMFANNITDEKHLKRYFYNFSPFATIIIIRNKIYYVPNMIQDDYYLSADSTNFDYDDNSEYGNESCEIAFCVKRNSKLGKKLVDAFDTFWLLKDKVEETAKDKAEETVKDKAEEIVKDVKDPPSILKRIKSMFRHKQRN